MNLNDETKANIEQYLEEILDIMEKLAQCPTPSTFFSTSLTNTISNLETMKSSLDYSPESIAEMTDEEVVRLFTRGEIPSDFIERNRWNALADEIQNY